MDSKTSSPADDQIAKDPETSLNAGTAPGRNALFAAIQSTRMPMILTDPHQPDNPIIFANIAFAELSGYPVEELLGQNCRFLQGEETSPEDVAKIRNAVATRTKISIDIVNYRRNGERFVNELYISPVFSPADHLLYFFGSQVDVTAYTEARLGLQLTLIERERYVLSQIAEGVPLSEVLEGLLRSVEAQSRRGMRTSILLVSEDGAHLQHGAAPSLPDAYNKAIDGIPTGDGVGSCGTAATRGTPVYVNDIATDPLWTDFRDLALSNDLRACWSSPIKDARGAVLGTFAIYYDTPRSPTPEEITTISFVTQTAALAIERHRSELQLRRGERELTEVNEALQLANQRLNEVNETLERTVEDRTQEVRLFRDIVQSDESPVVAFDTSMRITAFNRAHRDAYLRVYGIEQQVGDSLLEQFLPDQAKVVQGFMARALAGESFIVRESFGDPDLEKPAWQIAYNPLRDERGDVIGGFHHALDITSEVTAQANLARAEEALRQSQKMEAIGQLTGGVAHDFNNLLTVIRGSVDALHREDLPAERRQRYLEALSDTADRAAKLTGQLLAFARRQTLEPEVFDVAHRLDAVADMLDSITGARVQVRVEAPPEACRVLADVSQFETALVNLAVNARDAMGGEGAITIRLSCGVTMPAIRGHGPGVGDFVSVAVSDTGSGIAHSDLEHIFEPFFTTKEVGKGTGLGLSQIFGFAKQSGGDVDVESTVGVGSTFTLYLPMADQAGTPATPVLSNRELADGEGRRVLVVEDNVSVGQFATQLLSDLGYQTAWATSAEEALERLGPDGDGFDIVFSDVVMPGMGGLELAKRLATKLPTMPIVLTSGYSNVLAREGARGVELIRKPYSAQQLSDTLQQKLASLRNV